MVKYESLLQKMTDTAIRIVVISRLLWIKKPQRGSHGMECAQNKNEVGQL